MKKFMTSLLAYAITATLLLPSIQPVVVYAQTNEEPKTVSANQVVSDNNASQEAETDSEEVTTETLGAMSPANPVHHCTKDTDDTGNTDTTDWSYIYFGSYPQSEVTDAATISTINSAIAAGNSTGDTGEDVWVNGAKYRRIAKTDTNFDYYFGDSTYRYFKWERIKWRVLQNNGTDLFVMADMALDCKCYNDEYVDVTWETSTLRGWLNDSFLKTAFSSAEQEAILNTTVVNDDNLYYNTEGGNNTIDKVYLLSIAQAASETYGFCSDDNMESVSRRITTSDYAYARGAWQSTSSDDAGNTWWWLRSPGDDSNYAADVSYGGYVYSHGSNVRTSLGGVVTALHLNLSSDLWYLTDDGTSGAGGNENKLEEQPDEPTQPTTPTKPSNPSETTEPSQPTSPPQSTMPTGATETDNTTNYEKQLEEIAQKYNVSQDTLNITEESITNRTSDSDIKGSSFGKLKAKATKNGKNSIKLSWSKVEGADGYIVYGNRCNTTSKKYKCKRMKTLSANKTSYTAKKLKKGQYYKFIVRAYKNVNGKKVTIASSVTIHSITKGGKYGVAKSVKIEKIGKKKNTTKITLKKGKTATIKAKEIKESKPIKRHRKLVYESSNKKVATVSKSGKIKAKGKGKCKIYVYAQNGVYKTITVTVK